MNPFKVFASEKEGDYIQEENDTVFKYIDKEGNIFDLESEDVVIKMPTFQSDPSTVSYGVVNFRTKPDASYNTYYIDDNTKKQGYINGFCSGEGAYLGLSADKTQVKFKIAGMVGWVDRSDVDVLSYKNCKSMSHYVVENGMLYHYGTIDISQSDHIITNNMGYAPSYLNGNTRYYSYDGHYFYTSFETMIDDYRNNVYTHSVNPGNPYYNYYQYLPLRSKTNLTAEQFNSYIPSYAKSGKMANIGQLLIDAQNTYGVNAMMIYVQAAFESGWGTSSIAINKNNLFGHGAADNDPYTGAKIYGSVSECVTHHAKVVLSEGYFDPKDYSGRFYGCHCGDKSSGIIVHYGSDPYWGEKVASMCWILDRTFNTNDHSIYTLGIRESNANVNVYANVDKRNILYTSGTFLNYPVIILEEGSMYKIQSDSTLKADRSAIIQDNGYYDFDTNYAYIDKTGIRIVSVGNNQYPSSVQYKWVERNGIWYYVDKDGNKKTGWVQYKHNWYYLDPSDGHMVTGWLNNTYYMTSTGEMVTGWQTIDGKQYYFDVNGKYVPKEGRYNWEKVGNDWKLKDTIENTYIINGWKEVKDKWYYFENGIMKTGWVFYKNEWYLLSDSGDMLTGWQKKNGKWYYFNEDGAMVTGWLDATYYLSENGDMVIGWQEIENEWYYFNPGGEKVTNQWVGNYYLGNTGKMVTNDWIYDQNQWYLVSNDGKKLTGWQKVNNKWYYMDESGVMATGWIKDNGIWYYLQSNGAMVTGWKQIGTKWYYFYGSGAMASNTYIDGYYVDSSGAWVQ